MPWHCSRRESASLRREAAYESWTKPSAGLLRCVFEIRKLSFPVISLRVQKLGEFEKILITGAVVEPENGVNVILPPVITPIPEATIRQLANS